MLKKDLKLGSCFKMKNNDIILEGVITEIHDYHLTAQCLYSDWQIADIIFPLSDILLFEYVPVPHFCKVENLSEIFQKYCKKYDAKIQVLGFFEKHLDFDKYQYVSYYKIGDIFLQVSSFMEDDRYFPLHAYIKEVQRLNDFYIPDYEVKYYSIKETRFFFAGNNAILRDDKFSELCGLKNVYNDPVGVTFFDNTNYWEWSLSLFQLKNDEIKSGFIYNEKMFDKSSDKNEFLYKMKYVII